MGNNEIVINEDFLHQLQVKYTAHVDDIDQLYGKVYPYGTLPDSHVDFTKPFVLLLGGANFEEATDVTEPLEAVRSDLAERFSGARGQLYTLEWGIKFLLDDSEATEQLSTLSAEQFEHFMPQSS